MTSRGQRQNEEVATDPAKQRLDRGAGVGRLGAGQTPAARRRVEAALAGELDERELNADERAAFNAELDASISQAAPTVRFGEVLAARGEITVALGEHGRPTRYHPDGTTSPLE